MSSPRTVTMSRRAAGAILASVREERRQRLESRCRDSFAAFFREGWSVIESRPLLWGPHLDALCDTAQAFAEGWIVVHRGAGKREEWSEDHRAMVARQARHWHAAVDRHVAETEEDREHWDDLLAGEPWLREMLCQNLVVNGGPTTLKSRIWMVYLQPWVWLRVPSATFACTSGTAHNVKRDSKHAHDLASSQWYRETFQIPWVVGVTRQRDETAGVEKGKSVDNNEEWVTSAGGVRISKSWLTSWSGIHVDFLLGDDPNDAKRVWSAAHREETQETYDLSMGNRLNMNAATMMLQQHVHSDDLTSRLKTRGLEILPGDEDNRARIDRARAQGTWSLARRKQWGALVLRVRHNPRKAPRTPWGWEDWRTEPGEVIFPQQWTPEYIASEMDRLGPQGFSAQADQDPEHASGGELKAEWIRFAVIDGDAEPFRPRPFGCQPRGGDGVEPPFVIKRKAGGRLDLDWITLSVDPRNDGRGRKSSNTGLVMMGGKGGRRIILDDRSARLEFLDSLDIIEQMIRDWMPDLVLVERKALGAASTATLRRKIQDAKLVGANGRPIVTRIEDVEANLRFEDRWNSALPTFRANLVYVMDGAHWADEYVSEVTAVPNGAQDDRADATAQCINHYASHGTATEALRRDIEAMRKLGAMR